MLVLGCVFGVFLVFCVAVAVAVSVDISGILWWWSVVPWWSCMPCYA